ncbi:hypothetical protein [Microbacterium sp. 10M-3C3]|jgi:hypothetical protein|uniref:hypothetical protein n=1 Tax=Microbacterium sp. 10M-3C3 TaxID=2483401 RepID=UPI000F638E92|nr:hypothetical protein [Microbacterium sp. 10M-3C3]
MNRTLNVVRMQFVNRQTYLWVPLIVLGGSLVLSILVWALIPYDGPKYGGGAQAPFWYFGVVGVQALTLTFPFSQAMSVTRREYYLGTLLTAGLTSAILTAIFLVGAGIERATGGWGVNGYFFLLDWVWGAGVLGAALFYFAIAMLFFAAGFLGATVYKRYGMVGVTVGLIGLGLVLVALLWSIGRADAWASFFGWFADLGPAGLGALLAALAAAAAVVAFPLLRRATP